MKLLSSQAEHLHTRVETAQQTLPDAEWESYKQWCVALPNRLRENGLVQTLRLLRHEAVENGGARRLLRDWLCLDSDRMPRDKNAGKPEPQPGLVAHGSTAPLSLASLLPGTDADQRCVVSQTFRRSAHYGLASRLALAEA